MIFFRFLLLFQAWELVLKVLVTFLSKLIISINYVNMVLDSLI